MKVIEALDQFERRNGRSAHTALARYCLQNPESLQWLRDLSIPPNPQVPIDCLCEAAILEILIGKCAPSDRRSREAYARNIEKYLARALKE